jgi:hypothetical protein
MFLTKYISVLSLFLWIIPNTIFAQHIEGLPKVKDLDLKKIKGQVDTTITTVKELDLKKLKGQLKNKVDTTIAKLKDKIEKTKKAKPLEVSGSVAVNAIATVSVGSPNPQPFSYVATGNVNAKVYGYDVPLSFTYSNKQFNHTNPSFKFNRASVMPNFKKLNLGTSIGDFGMVFTPYTLNGFQCTGLGGEFTPGRFRIQALYGRFMRKSPEDSLGLTPPSFQRMGGGMNIAYNGSKYKLGLAVFYANDDEKSIGIPQKLYGGALIRPKENVTVSFKTGLPLASKLSLENEYAVSLMTENKLSGEKDNTKDTPLSILLKNRNNSTHLYQAIKTNLNYIIGESGTVGLGFERVTPDYHTLGGYFFNNDFENITINTQHKGAINTSFSTGLQFDNLANKNRTQTGRMVILGNTNFKIGEPMQVNMTYSNFQSYTFIRTGFENINRITPYDNVDTLDFTQLSQNASTNISYNFKDDSLKTQKMAMTMSFMESANKKNKIDSTLGIVQLNNGTKFLNGQLTYSIVFLNSKFMINSGFNVSLNYGGISNTLTMGPNIMMTKQLFNEKVNANAGIAYNISQNQDLENRTLTVNIGATTVVKEKHNLVMSVIGQSRYATNNSNKYQLSLNLGYNYNF